MDSLWLESEKSTTAGIDTQQSMMQFLTVRELSYMNKDLKMLLISIVALILVVWGAYVLENRTCSLIEYQDLGGSHSKEVCEWEE